MMSKGKKSPVAAINPVKSKRVNTKKADASTVRKRARDDVVLPRSKVANPIASASILRPIVDHFLSQLAFGEARGRGIESAEDAAPVDLSPVRVDERMALLESEWHRVIENCLDDDLKLHALVKKIAREGGEALRVLGDHDERRLTEDVAQRARLEVIVAMDGSRPSFMIREGLVDRGTSPIGSWGDALDASANLLGSAIACVGRIDVPNSSQGFEGTAFLVAENLIVTNRHVLQVIAGESSPGKWQLKQGVSIDFGHEFRGLDTVNRRKLKRVLFAGSKRIDPFGLDHGCLDLAVIELAPAKPAERLKEYLSIDASPDWSQRDQTIYIVGYPGRPAVGAENVTLLERVFKQTFGCKRLAPGLVTVAPSDLPESPRDWSTGHDATTLGGNSGSAVLVIGRERIAAGLHYGGTRASPRVNWAHVLGLALDETDGISSGTLRELFETHGVELIDRLDP